jgi:K+-sensing histidine kinase KdpD
LLHVGRMPSGEKLRIDPHSWLRGAAIVLGSLIFATLLTFPISATVIYSRSLLYMAAVIVASRYAGAVAGLCTALLSVLLFSWFFDTTPQVLDLTLAGLFRAGVFCGVSLLVASLESQRRRAIDSLEETNRQLRNSLEEIKILRGILSVCQFCRHVRTEAGSWAQMEEYIREHSEAEFRQSVCPDCLRKHYPDIYDKKYGPTNPG